MYSLYCLSHMRKLFFLFSGKKQKQKEHVHYKLVKNISFRKQKLLEKSGILASPEYASVFIQFKSGSIFRIFFYIF